MKQTNMNEWKTNMNEQKTNKHKGLKNNCTFCGVFRRQALDRGATLLGVDKIVTGMNSKQTNMNNKHEWIKQTNMNNKQTWIKQTNMNNKHEWMINKHEWINKQTWIKQTNMNKQGHNADDMAETVLLNLLRGDIARLQRFVYSCSFF